LSVTRTEIKFVLGPCVSVGVQLKTPFAEFIVAFVGAPATRLNERVCVGQSASLAILVKVKVVCSKII